MSGPTLKVGFVGLGDQGGPMAVAIAEAGFSVDLLALCLRDDHDIEDLIAHQGGLTEKLRVNRRQYRYFAYSVSDITEENQ